VPILTSAGKSQYREKVFDVKIEILVEIQSSLAIVNDDNREATDGSGKEPRI
jgi:hypothetical protein